MADAQDEFDKAFENFGEEPQQPESPKVEEQPAAPAAPAPAAPEAPKEEPKPNEPPAPAEEPKKEEAPAPTGDAPKTQEEPKPAEAPAPAPAPETPEEPKPLTEGTVRSIINEIRTEERTSGKMLEDTKKEVLEAFYPEGLSHDLIDQNTGKVLKSPADVVAATNGQMNMEEAAQWLMNEQYKLDQEVSKIESQAEKIAETTINFKRDSIAALQKYEPLFKAYPHLQAKVWDNLKKQVKADTEKGVILSAPDVMEHYDFYLEPYQQAFEFATQQPATAPPAPAPAAPAPPTPGMEDRLDEGGDGGASQVDDPSDFAQQVTKELSKGF